MRMGMDLGRMHRGERARGVMAAAASLAALSIAGAAQAAGPDGWDDIASNPPTVVLTPVTGIGVTHGTQSLRAEVPQGQNAFWGIMSPNIVDQLKAGATGLSYDETLNGQELNGGAFGGGTDDSFNGFAQSNELAVVIAAPAGGFIQQSFAAANGTDSLGQGAGWNGVDGTRHITWDLTTFKSGGMSLADFINANSATDARIWLVTQGGDSNGNVGPMRFYFDNVALSGGTGGTTVIGDFEAVPEPASLAACGFALAIPLLRRRHRRG